MRKILFRGKRIDNNTWELGHLIRYDDCRARILPNSKDIFCYEKDRSIIQTVAFEVDRFTVSQFTGLTDKNGKMIFEGDIVRYIFPVENAIPDIGVVKFSESERTCGQFICGFYIDWNDRGMLRKDISYWTSYKENKIEVIGNIYDNPELLKGVSK